MARQVEDPGPFRFSEIHGPQRTVGERIHAVDLLKLGGLDQRSLTFELVRIPALELIESLIFEAYHTGRSTFDYVAWRRIGAPEGLLREAWAQTDSARRASTPKHTARIEELERLYAQGVEVDPLIAIPLNDVLSSGEQAVFVLDGRHRVFAAVATGVDVLRVYLALRKRDQIVTRHD